MKKSIKLLAVLILLIFAVCLPQAQATYDIFMQIDGIPGDSTDINHAGWNTVYSFSHQITKPSPTSPPNHASFSIAKRLDKASPAVNLKLNQGAMIPKITVEFQSAGSSPAVFYKVVMENVLFDGVSSTGSEGSDFVIETVTVNYTKITWTYFSIDPKTGKAGNPVTSFWDVKSQKGL